MGPISVVGTFLAKAFHDREYPDKYGLPYSWLGLEEEAGEGDILYFWKDRESGTNGGGARLAVIGCFSLLDEAKKVREETGSIPCNFGINEDETSELVRFLEQESKPKPSKKKKK